MADVFVRFDGVSKSFKGNVVVNHIDLRITRGETTALCGGNGAGKSTLLRMLAGIVCPTDGELTVDGISWRQDRKRYASQIGYMPDDYRFSPGLTAMETMTFWAKLRGLGREQAAEALAAVGLSDTGNKAVASFSKGMRQRILFAQAILAKPKLIVMDEPTNGLDPYWMETFAELVRQAGASGQTILFSTHQVQIAEALAHRVVLLREGKVVLDAGLDDIRAHYGEAGLYQAFGEWFGLPGARTR